MLGRKKSCGGQALVMVTLALFAMGGMMGLAVDLGWSFFVQKQAQSAADGAALAAVTRAYNSMSNAGIAPTVWIGCGSNGVDCQPSPTACAGIATGNLRNGCLYATANGFTDGASSQRVTMQANSKAIALPSAIPTPPGPPADMVYWVTARTAQTVPQLFSALLGNTQSTVSAVGTAAIASKVIPGSFYGMNHKGDCTFNNARQAVDDCGVDMDANGHGAACPGGVGNAYLCAPAGVVLSSSCHGATTGCAGYAGSGGPVWGGPGINIYTGGAVQNPGSWNPTPINTASSSALNDPLQGVPQPPVAPTASGAIGSCGYLNGDLPSNTTFGPYQYYSYKIVSTVKIPDGQPIALGNGVKFSPAVSGCPGGGIFTAGAPQTGSVPSFIFYGGMDVGNSVTFGPGQYVMAGTVTSGGAIFSSKNASIDYDYTQGSAGMMIVSTDGTYPGLATQLANVPQYTNAQSKLNPSAPSLYQGNFDLKNTDIGDTTHPLLGLDKTNFGGGNGALAPYDGVLVWQDRRNSTVVYNKSGPTVACAACTKDDGTVVYCSDCTAGPATQAMYDENRVTASSPELSLNDGRGSAFLKGALYQPRGAWFVVNPGNFGVENSPLQILTGALLRGGGNTQVTLTGPSNQLIAYKPVLIQ